jgi:hypothetical protein
MGAKEFYKMAVLTKNGAPVAAGASIPMGSNGADINALLGGIVDRKKWYWYDTLKFAPGATVAAQEYNFFAVAQGQPDPYNNNQVKSYLDTNITPPGGQFSSPYDCVLTNLGFKYSSDMVLYDIIQIEKYAFFKFNILEKIFFKGHVWRHPPGAGITGQTSKTNEAVWNNGTADPGAIYYFGQWSKYIPPLTTFGLTLQWFQTVGLATQGSNTATLGASATAAGQSAATLPTFLTSAQGGNGVWLQAIMNGLSDGPVQ